MDTLISVLLFLSSGPTWFGPVVLYRVSMLVNVVSMYSQLARENWRRVPFESLVIVIPLKVSSKVPGPLIVVLPSVDVTGSACSNHWA